MAGLKSPIAWPPARIPWRFCRTQLLSNLARMDRHVPWPSALSLAQFDKSCVLQNLQGIRGGGHAIVGFSNHVTDRWQTDRCQTVEKQIVCALVADRMCAKGCLTNFVSKVGACAHRQACCSWKWNSIILAPKCSYSPDLSFAAILAWLNFMILDFTKLPWRSPD